jgi:hypothetical protein
MFPCHFYWFLFKVFSPVVLVVVSSMCDDCFFETLFIRFLVLPIILILVMQHVYSMIPKWTIILFFELIFVVVSIDSLVYMVDMNMIYDITLCHRVVVQFSCQFGEYLASPRRLAIDGYEGDLLLHNFWNNAIFMEQLGW